MNHLNWFKYSQFINTLVLFSAYTRRDESCELFGRLACEIHGVQ